MDRLLGVIMTGMGKDGLEGLRKIKQKGGMVVAQNEETCVVYGMPKAAVDDGIADLVLPLEDIPGGTDEDRQRVTMTNRDSNADDFTDLAEFKKIGMAHLRAENNVIKSVHVVQTGVEEIHRDADRPVRTGCHRASRWRHRSFLSILYANVAILRAFGSPMTKNSHHMADIGHFPALRILPLNVVFPR